MDAVISADGVLRFENNAHTQLAPPSPPPSPPLGAAPADFDLDSDDSEEDFGPPPSPPCPEEEIPTPDPVEEKATQEEMQVCTVLSSTLIRIVKRTFFKFTSRH